jgi:hypothetical protein
MASQLDEADPFVVDLAEVDLVRGEDDDHVVALPVPLGHREAYDSVLTSRLGVESWALGVFFSDHPRRDVRVRGVRYGLRLDAGHSVRSARAH